MGVFWFIKRKNLSKQQCLTASFMRPVNLVLQSDLCNEAVPGCDEKRFLGQCQG